MPKRILGFLQFQMRPYLTAVGKKDLPTQLGELWWLWRYYRFLPYQYLKFNLYFKQVGEAYKRYLPPELVHKVQWVLNRKEDRSLAANKATFASMMTSKGVNVVTELFRNLPDGRIVDRHGRTITVNAALRVVEELGGTVFMKPTSGTRGQSTGMFHLHESSTMLPVYGQDILFQQLLTQHPIIASFNQTSINTVRVVTLHTPDGIRLDGAVFRMGLRGKPVDNWSAGGVAVGVNLEDGTLMRYGVRERKFGGEVFAAHPDSGITFEGFQLPYWDRILSLVTEAAKAIYPLRTIGWDVAFCPEGPMIVEANEEWHVEFLQICWGGLRDTPIGKIALHCHRTGTLDCQ